MSDPSPSPIENTGSPKKKVSLTRNLIGIIVLVLVLVVAGFQYAALIRYTVAMKALNARAVDDGKSLVTNQEADSLLGKCRRSRQRIHGRGSELHEEDVYLARTAQVLLADGILHERGGRFLAPLRGQGEEACAKWSPATKSVPPIRISKGKGRSKKKGASTAKGDAKTATVPGKVTAPAAAGEPTKATAAPATAAGPADVPPTPTTIPDPAAAKPGAPPAEPSKDAPAASGPT